MSEFFEVHLERIIPRLLRENVDFQTPDDVWKLMNEQDKFDYDFGCKIPNSFLADALKNKIPDKKELLQRETYKILVVIFEKHENGEETYLGSRFE